MGRCRHLYSIFLLVFGIAATAIITGCDGQADPPSKGTHLGDAVIDPGNGGSGGTRSDLDPGQLYTVTKIVEATSGITGYTATDYPFNTGTQPFYVGPAAAPTNTQWPFEFNYTYPSNNYAMTEAHLFLVTQRDSSDTEAIYIDGIFTGRPPGSMVQNSPKYTDILLSCSGACSAVTNTGAANTFFMDWALSHYAIGTPNTFDINIDSLLTGTTKTATGLLSDGNFAVVSGDDAAIYGNIAGSSSAPLLVMVGSTYSTTALTCSTSPTYYLKNNYLHNDSNSIGQAAFSGTVLTPFTSWGSAYTTFRSVEFYFDPRLPTLSNYSGMNITKANITMQVKRASSDPTAIVINGIGIDQDGFDRNTADVAVVESWSTDAAARSAWNTLVNSIPANSTTQSMTIDLLALLGADTVKTLLLQGKLNIAVAGPIARISASAASTSRTYGTAVSGPQLVLEGNYTAEICQIPDNPNSPLNGGGGGGPAVCSGPDADVAPPSVSSIQVINITSSSATIQWLSNESATTQAGYGLLAPSTTSTLDSNLATFHSVNISGLQPYKYYQYNVRSVDACGNEIISATKSFRTLR